MSRRRAAALLPAVAVVLATAAATSLQSAASPPPPDLHGPISDFWDKVKRDWADRLPSLNRGPLQTFVWVAMVWDAPDDVPLRAVVDELQQREARRWVRSQMTKHRYRELTRRDLRKTQAMRQNLVLMGTPEDNDLVARALEPTPLKVGEGFVSIGPRRISGDSLLLVCIVPSPLAPGRYALVMTGSSPEAVLAATDVPFGDSDYILYRGRKVIDRGFFSWNADRVSADAVAKQKSFVEHFGWTTARSRHFRIKFDDNTVTGGAAEAAGRELDAALERAASFFGIPAARIEPIDYFLYASLDELLVQTGDTRMAHLDRVAMSVHAVGVETTLPAAVLLRRSDDWGARGEIELPGLALALRLASQEAFEGRSLSDWAAVSARERDYMPMDLLMARRPAAPESGDLSLLDAAAFARWLVTTEGPGRVASFYREARKPDYHEQFSKVFGRSISQAEKQWLATVTHAGPAQRARPAPRAGGDQAPDAGTLKDLFRSGRHAEAMDLARRILSAAQASPEDRAWARVTLGRIHAIQGRRASAMAELRSADIERGSETVQVLAAYWLETLGQPLNRRAAHAVLQQQAAIDLMNFDWDKAEAALRAILADDPLSREAHAALSEVYFSKYQYWYDYMLLDQELFPGMSMADPETYGYLADKGRAELRVAESLAPAGDSAEMPDFPRDNDRFIGLGVDKAAPHFLQGKVHYFKGDFAAARREMETALALEPRTTLLAAWCHLYLARMAAEAGDTDAARGHYQTILDLAPTGTLTKLAKQELGKLPVL